MTLRDGDVKLKSHPVHQYLDNNQLLQKGNRVSSLFKTVVKRHYLYLKFDFVP